MVYVISIVIALLLAGELVADSFTHVNLTNNEKYVNIPLDISDNKMNSGGSLNLVINVNVNLVVEIKGRKWVLEEELNGNFKDKFTEAIASALTEEDKEHLVSRIKQIPAIIPEDENTDTSTATSMVYHALSPEETSSTYDIDGMADDGITGNFDHTKGISANRIEKSQRFTSVQHRRKIAKDGSDDDVNIRFNRTQPLSFRTYQTKTETPHTMTERKGRRVLNNDKIGNVTIYEGICDPSEHELNVNIVSGNDGEFEGWRIFTMQGVQLKKRWFGDSVIDEEGWKNTTVCTSVEINCLELIFEGDFEYFQLFHNGVIIDSGEGYAGYSIRFGDPHECWVCETQRPLLSSFHGLKFDTRTFKILSMIKSISGADALIDPHSNEYAAACWIIFDDFAKVDASSPSLSQRYILALFFYSLSGEKWRRRTGFLTAQHECDWKREGNQGVFCGNDDSAVVHLELEKNNLHGTILHELSSLPFLEVLNLKGNSLSGTIPYELGYLKRLSVINLELNSLTGTITEAFFENYVPSTFSQPGEIQSYPEKHVAVLKELSLSFNELIGTIPNALFSITSLKIIGLRGNSLTGTLSTMIGNLGILTMFSVGRNKIHGNIPTEVGILTTLYRLDLSENEFTGEIPSTISGASDLKSFELNSNALSGKIPDAVGELNMLNYIDLSSNIITGAIPQNLVDAPDLFSILLNNNLLSGEVPDPFLVGFLLSELRLEKNLLTGQVPNKICEHFEEETGWNWKRIITSDCDAEYTKPEIICPCCTTCYGAFVSGPRIGDCPDDELKVVFKHDKDFDVEMKGSFKVTNGIDFTVMEEDVTVDPGSSDTEYSFSTCIASSDCFTYAYEPKLGNLPLYEIFSNGVLITKGQEKLRFEFGYSSSGKSLQKIDSCDPISICGQKDVHYGSRDRIKFNELVRISGLEKLAADTSNESPHYKAACWVIHENDKTLASMGNKLLQRYVLALLFYHNNGESWMINSEFLSKKHVCDWYGIRCSQDTHLVTNIDLQSNKLTGSLPQELSFLDLLQHLNLSGNTLNGALPMEFVNLRSLQEIDLSSNDLTGKIPKDVGEIKALTNLNLKNNNFGGTLPDSVFSLPKLAFLDLSNNEFNGKLSNDLAMLTSLLSLNLGSNFFTGDMPSTISNLSELKRLDLSQNEFQGSMPSDIGKLFSLTHLHLFDNSLEGSIPKSLQSITNLEVLLLSKNSITGIIPSGIGKLTRVARMALSYNSLKGHVPKELVELTNMELLHLQGNLLTGSVGEIRSTKTSIMKSLIADCGLPSESSDILKCSGCTECCNADNMCVKPVQTHVVKETLKYLGFTLAGTLGILLLLISALSYSKIFLLLDVRARYLAGEDSSYSFILSDSYVSYVVVLITLFIQFALYYIFLTAADWSSATSDWVYHLRCSFNNLECEDSKSINPLGLVFFWLIVFLDVAPDLFNGLKLIQKGIRFGRIKAAIVGFTLIIVTVLAIITSFVYNNAISQTNTELIINAVILLFITRVDEWVYASIRTVFPGWIAERDLEGEKYSNQLLNTRASLRSLVDTNDHHDAIRESGHLVDDLVLKVEMLSNENYSLKKRQDNIENQIKELKGNVDYSEEMWWKSVCNWPEEGKHARSPAHQWDLTLNHND